jgi:hypothetical protein
MNEAPYRPPRSTVLTTHGVPLRWRRVLGWACLIYAVGAVLGIMSGLAVARWQWFGSTLPEAVETLAQWRRIAIAISEVALYFLFAVGLRGRRVTGVLAVFVVVALIDVPVSRFAFGIPLEEMFSLASTAEDLLLAVVGLVLAEIVARSMRRPRTSAPQEE